MNDINSAVQRARMTGHQIVRRGVRSGPRIGVVCRPQTELQSHCSEAVLPRRFDEYVWFDETRAVAPLRSGVRKGLPDPYPFGQ